jgi:tetratricopeptide (TPR) repeat protein
MSKTNALACLLTLALAGCGGSKPTAGGATAAEVADSVPLTEEDLAPADEREVMVAIRAIDAGMVDRAIAILEGVRERYPHHFVLVHELALAMRVKGRPERAVELLRPYERHLNAQMAAALGSAFDEAGDSAAALESLERALERFPESGLLHSTIGTVHVRAERVEEALEWWERGIEAEPGWPSNYLHAARTYSHSNAPGLTLIYGETFRVLEPASPRSEELAETMVQAMRDAVHIEGSGEEFSGKMELAPTATMTIVGEGAPQPPGFAGMALVNVFEITYGVGLFIAFTEGLSLATLHKAKGMFLDVWWKPDGMHQHYDVPLFAWLKELRAAGLLEAYDYWLYAPAFPQEFAEWTASHLSQLQELQAWMDSNPLHEQPAAFGR